jgi:Domain of unknown function (DUF6048)
MYIRKIAGFILTTIALNIVNCKAQDSLDYVRSLRFGCDLTRFVLTQFQPERKAIEFSFDTEAKLDLFTTMEAGLEQTNKVTDLLSYHASGYYARVGVDYNILKHDKLEKGRDIVYIGIRYGYFHVTQQTDNYIIPGYFANDTLSGSIPSKSLNGHWLEPVFGLKVEVLKNLFLGVSIRGRILLFSQKGILGNFPDYMPGYGNGANKSNLGINYSIYYQIPIMKVRVKARVKPVKKVEIEVKKNK